MGGMIAIVDYGMGNLRSVQKAFEHLGYPAEVTCEPGRLRAAGGLVLPGVGAFAAGMRRLSGRGLEDAIRRAAEAGTPILGICLGMQLLFERGEEFGSHPGLGVLPGCVVRLETDPLLKIPHMGWNQLEEIRPSLLMEGIAEGAHVYFVHSYHALPGDGVEVIARTHYGIPVVATVGRGRVWGCQFHPEKSDRVGLRILQNFAKQA